MARRAVSVTLDEANLLWLRGRARVSDDGNLSKALDGLITAARTGRAGIDGAARSAVGLVTLPDDDPDLIKADEAVRALFEESLARPLYVREPSASYRTGARPRLKPAKARRRG